MIAMQSHAQTQLPALKLDENQTTVSGLSSGAYMAVQMQVAYSRSIAGAGVVAGGPYHCMAPVDGTNPYLKTPEVSQRVADCMMVKNYKTPLPFWTLKGKTPPDTAQLVAAARKAALDGRIDSLENLKNRKIYIFGGTRDETVGAPVVSATKDFFTQLGVDERNNIEFVNDKPAGHAFITDNFGNECGIASKEPYISNCKYDQAKAILKHLYGDPKPVDAKYADKPGQLLKLSQAEAAKKATGDASSTPLDTAFLEADAYLYVPAACAASEPCKLHVVFHGCHQSARMLKSQAVTHMGFNETYFIDNAGYNRWADKYNVVLLYPQAAASSMWAFPKLNPNGCWDWWGYTDVSRSDYLKKSYYAYKDGYQMKAVKAMVDSLTGN
ncbi:extracellular catalytic domain type 2 short-chain-length polyhydroxyalkanoate depolymerase [Azohydromonas aeria]